MNEISERLFSSIEREQLAGLATVMTGAAIGRKMLLYPNGEVIGSLGSNLLDEEITKSASRVFENQEPERITIDDQDEQVEVFFDVYPPLPRLVVVGAVHIAIPLVHLANTMGYRTIVIDARSIFANRDRFPHADELIVEWPSDVLKKMNINEATYIVTLTHDEKFDNPVLQIALQSRARYVGALGSKKTHANRVESLKEMGISQEQIERIHAPIGLKIGGRAPEEIALSIMTEIVAVRHNYPLHQ